MQRKLQLHLNWSKGTGMMSGLERDICIIHRGCEQRYEIHPKGPHHIYIYMYIYTIHGWYGGWLKMVSIPMEKKTRHPEEVQSCHPGCLWKLHEGCCATRGPNFQCKAAIIQNGFLAFHMFFFAQFIQRWIRWSEWIWQHRGLCCQNKTTTVIHGYCSEDIFSMIFLQGINDTASTMGW